MKMLQNWVKIGENRALGRLIHYSKQKFCYGE